MEIWKDIKGYEGLYQVSTLGRVKSLDRVVNYKDGRVRTIKERLLKLSNSGKGYPFVTLSKENSSPPKTIHRLMAMAFLPNPENKSQINHINGIKADNRVENLEWCTPKENIRHAYTHGLNVVKVGQDCGASKLTEVEVLEIRRLIKGDNIQRDIATQYGISPSTICDIKYNRSWSHIQ